MESNVAKRKKKRAPRKKPISFFDLMAKNKEVIEIEKGEDKDKDAEEKAK